MFSVPGNIDEKLSGGTNALIRDGAVPLLSAMDVIDELIEKNPDFFMKERESLEDEFHDDFTLEEKLEIKAKTEGLSEYEKEIVNIIISGAQTQNLIEENISFGAERLTALLGMMEIKGIIKKGPNKKYIIL